jgi:uncharacterized protein
MRFSIAHLPARSIVFAIRVYQKLLSPLLGNNCRFSPTCSEYSAQAVGKYGVVRGGILAIKRISKCHPFHPGGIDNVP